LARSFFSGFCLRSKIALRLLLVGTQFIHCIIVNVEPRFSGTQVFRNQEVGNDIGDD
jgi:hypothetical protein